MVLNSKMGEINQGIEDSKKRRSRVLLDEDNSFDDRISPNSEG